MREILFRGFHPDENGPQEITLDGIKIKGRWVQGDFCHPCNIIVEEIGDDPALGQKNVTIFKITDTFSIIYILKYFIKDSYISCPFRQVSVR